MAFDHSKYYALRPMDFVGILALLSFEVLGAPPTKLLEPAEPTVKEQPQTPAKEICDEDYVTIEETRLIPPPFQTEFDRLKSTKGFADSTLIRMAVENIGKAGQKTIEEALPEFTVLADEDKPIDGKLRMRSKIAEVVVQILDDSEPARAWVDHELSLGDSSPDHNNFLAQALVDSSKRRNLKVENGDEKKALLAMAREMEPLFEVRNSLIDSSERRRALRAAMAKVFVELNSDGRLQKALQGARRIGSIKPMFFPRIPGIGLNFRV